MLQLTGCGLWHPTKAPMDVVHDHAVCATRPETLLVLLPGSYSTPDDFVREGFVAEVRARGLAVDIAMPDAHLGYYSDRSVIDRLHADVVLPARQQGYRRIVLAGISVGAFGALIYAEAHPGEVARLIAIAPYLGSRLTSNGIDRAGGLKAWHAPQTAPGMEDDENLWRWLQGYASPTSAAARPPLLLAYGDSDRFLFSEKLLSAALPAGTTFTAPGGHDWPAWRPLWQQLLDAGALGVTASCKP